MEGFSFGEWVRQRRSALLLSREDLAEQVGCAVVSLRKIEADERRPSLAVAERLADRLELADEQRTVFLQVARGLLAPDHLPPPVPGRATPVTPGMSGPSSALPSGTVTFLFTDIEGSTKLWEQHKQAISAALARHNDILQQAITAHDGRVFKIVGDAVCAVFGSAPNALLATLDAQRALHTENWTTMGLPAGERLRVRVALHTGTAVVHNGEYQGLALSRVARLLAAGHGGQILLSLATAELVREHLPPDAELRDLGIHRLKDLTRPEQIFQLLVPDLPGTFPPLNTLDTRRTNLPAQPTPLIGREQEVAGVCAVLRRDDTRLVTLTGPGGTGKTRLALQVAANLLSVAHLPRTLPRPSAEEQHRERGLGDRNLFPDGIFFVDLSAVREPPQVAATIARDLDLTVLADKTPAEVLAAFLREKDLLLVLDNFEQLLDAAPLLAELLRASAGLVLLVTSRATLHLSGEHEYPVPPLALPPTTDDRSLPLSPSLPLRIYSAKGPTTDDTQDAAVDGQWSVVTQYAAVKLFIERAQAVRPDFVVTNANAPAVAEICHRLDGLPLAIELAAARIKLFPPEALLVRLSNRLAMLTGGARDLPARQQTLRNTIAWSYELLNDAERANSARSAVFAGGFTLEAATEVLIDAGQEPRQLAHSPTLITQTSILDGLAALVDKSLLKQFQGPGGESRFTLLETIREYSLERLAERGELEMMQRQHAGYFLNLAERAEPNLRSGEQMEWLERLNTEYDNLRMALEWSLGAESEQSQSAIGLRLAGSLWYYWLLRGRFAEGRRWLECDAVHDEAHPPELRARALLGAAELRAGLALPSWETLAT